MYIAICSCMCLCECVCVWLVAWQPNIDKKVSSHKMDGSARGLEHWIQTATKYNISIPLDTYWSTCINHTSSFRGVWEHNYCGRVGVYVHTCACRCVCVCVCMQNLI